MVGAFHHPKLGVGNAFVFEQRREAAPVLGQVKGFVRRAHDLDAVAFQLFRKLERGLASELHNDPLGLLVQDDVVDVLPKDGLEVKLVRRVKVRGHRLRVAVDHDGFVATLLGGQHPVHATIVEFNALTNAVGPAAQHHNLLLVGDHTFVGLLLKRAVVVGRQRREFSGARVHQLVHSGDALCVTTGVHFRFQAFQNVCNLAVGVSLPLRFTQHLRGQVLDVVLAKFLLEHDEFLDLAQEPRVDFGGLENAAERNAQLEGVVDVEQAVPTGVTQTLHDGILVAKLASVSAKAIALQFQ